MRKKMQSEEEENHKNYVRRERATQTFCRRIELSEKINSDDAKANLTNGILKLFYLRKSLKKPKNCRLLNRKLFSFKFF